MKKSMAEHRITLRGSRAIQLPESTDQTDKLCSPKFVLEPFKRFLEKGQDRLISDHRRARAKADDEFLDSVINPARLICSRPGLPIFIRGALTFVVCTVHA